MMLEAERQKKRVSRETHSLFNSLLMRDTVQARLSRRTLAHQLQGIPATALYKEQTMETIFHLLGIVYYTVALVHLVSEQIQKRKNEE